MVALSTGRRRSVDNENADDGKETPQGTVINNVEQVASDEVRVVDDV